MSFFCAAKGFASAELQNPAYCMNHIYGEQCFGCEEYQKGKPDPRYPAPAIISLVLINPWNVMFLDANDSCASDHTIWREPPNWFKD